MENPGHGAYEDILALKVETDKPRNNKPTNSFYSNTVRNQFERVQPGK